MQPDPAPLSVSIAPPSRQVGDPLGVSRPRDAPPPGAKNVHLRNNLYVGNLGSTDDRDLESLLSRFGTVRFAAVVAVDRPTSGARFGVVEMQREDDARAAIRTLNGFEIRGRLLTVRWATPPEQTACGHPAMFGTMNMASGDGGEGASGGAPPEQDTPIR
jgi:RNA recognition motif-containing protein